MNFDEIKNKASEVLEQHHEQVDAGIDRAAEFVAGRFGHEEQVKSVAEKAKDILPGGE
ncbi:antitoxin protein of toxin-antitoxin system [Saccharothrix carnea]|uniref:Antitoxin protein of toxin-antitoxin system n=1 Tax=Saccharothrix carnea TaxID=1280637 RepID=A0A2P8IAP7_SACCR|nr:antitoxin [Saccharothrix carnea]PSL55546.1 antitoxin protein of toxin-antitoxin system [Saccharothrix carnea]